MRKVLFREGHWAAQSHVVSNREARPWSQMDLSVARTSHYCWLPGLSSLWGKLSGALCWDRTTQQSHSYYGGSRQAFSQEIQSQLGTRVEQAGSAGDLDVTTQERAAVGLAPGALPKLLPLGLQSSSTIRDKGWAMSPEPFICKSVPGWSHTRGLWAGGRQSTGHNSHTRLFRMGSTWDMNDTRKNVLFMGLKTAAISLLSKHFHICGFLKLAPHRRTTWLLGLERTLGITISIPSTPRRGD